MNDQAVRYLALSWRAYAELSARLGIESYEAELIEWAYDDLDKLVVQSPETALKVILEVLEVCKNERSLNNLAAGPLENLLVNHGQNVVDEFIQRASNNQNFYGLLQRVWCGRMDEDVRLKLENFYLI